MRHSATTQVNLTLHERLHRIAFRGANHAVYMLSLAMMLSAYRHKYVYSIYIPLISLINHVPFSASACAALAAIRAFFFSANFFINFLFSIAFTAAFCPASFFPNALP